MCGHDVSPAHVHGRGLGDVGRCGAGVGDFVRPVIALGAAILICGCQRPPQPPPNAIRCGSDWDCPDGYSCAFPDVDTYAVCLPGNDHRWDISIQKRHKGARRPQVKP